MWGYNFFHLWIFCNRKFLNGKVLTLLKVIAWKDQCVRCWLWCMIPWLILEDIYVFIIILVAYLLFVTKLNKIYFQHIYTEKKIYNRSMNWKPIKTIRKSLKSTRNDILVTTKKKGLKLFNYYNWVFC